MATDPIAADRHGNTRNLEPAPPISLRFGGPHSGVTLHRRRVNEGVTVAAIDAGAAALRG